MGDHADTHALKITLVAVLGNAFEHFVHPYRRPVHPNEIAVGIIAAFFAMAGQTTVGAVGAATFRVGHQQIQAVGTGGAMHHAGHQTQGNGCRRT